MPILGLVSLAVGMRLVILAFSPVLPSGFLFYAPSSYLEASWSAYEWAFYEVLLLQRQGRFGTSAEALDEFSEWADLPPDSPQLVHAESQLVPGSVRASSSRVRLATTSRDGAYLCRVELARVDVTMEPAEGPWSMPDDVTTCTRRYGLWPLVRPIGLDRMPDDPMEGWSGPMPDWPEKEGP